jgi:hypothetical protein
MRIQLGLRSKAAKTSIDNAKENLANTFLGTFPWSDESREEIYGIVDDLVEGILLEIQHQWEQYIKGEHHERNS